VGSAKHLLVARTGDAWSDVAGVGAVDLDGPYDGWWTAGYAATSRADEALMREVMAATGAPVLLGTVDSDDCLFLRGLTQAGYWERLTRTGDYVSAVSAMLIDIDQVAALIEQDRRSEVDVLYERAEDAVEPMLAAAAPALADDLTAWSEAAGWPVDRRRYLSIVSIGNSIGGNFLLAILAEMGLAEPMTYAAWP
jgi:hypothetical protein